MTPQMWIDVSLYIVAGLFWVLFLAGAVAGVLGVMQMQADIKRRERTDREEMEINHLIEMVKRREAQMKHNRRKEDP